MTDYQDLEEQVRGLAERVRALEWELTYGFGPTARKPTFQELYYRLSTVDSLMDDVEMRLNQLEESVGEMMPVNFGAVMPVSEEDEA